RPAPHLRRDVQKLPHDATLAERLRERLPGQIVSVGVVLRQLGLHRRRVPAATYHAHANPLRRGMAAATVPPRQLLAAQPGLLRPSRTRRSDLMSTKVAFSSRCHTYSRSS